MDPVLTAVPAVVPAVAAVLAVPVAALPGARHRAVPAVVAVLVVSAVTLPFGPSTGGYAGAAMLAEAAAVLGLAFLTARHAPARPAVALCLLLCALAACVTLRVRIPASPAEVAEQCSFFALGAVLASGAGRYLRIVEERRHRAVEHTRQEERLRLARDLHDFVAHDLSGIVALAQAARLVGAERPAETLPLLGTIESLGLQALATTDRTVHLLDATGPAHGLDDIADAVESFRATTPAEVVHHTALSRAHQDGMPREIAATAHRIVVEALTNVRRHAPASPRVAVSLAADAPGRAPAALVVTVTNTPAQQPGERTVRARRGGTGLVALAERTRALGGTFDSGRDPSGGWRVTARLPYA
ncbi:sensor histidine kinase [Streptomyces sp. NPDC049879]|uniref:sensor histidine kinase n=1 Tax=Streptomyces sp. NPDC049879 TaxID=3365598 RepID=UPI0037BC4510